MCPMELIQKLSLASLQMCVGMHDGRALQAQVLKEEIRHLVFAGPPAPLSTLLSPAEGAIS